MKIVLDGFGGDYSPDEVVKGAALALDSDKDINLAITGKRDVLDVLVRQFCLKDSARIEIVDAPEIISCEEQPTTAIRGKKDSSLVRALDLVKEGSADGMVSAGSTGAVLVGATLKIGRIQGVERPALAPVLPTCKGGSVVLCDCGANVECKPSYLVGFAYMAAAYAQCVLGVKNPRVGLLNNGAEETKGTELCKEAYALLKGAENINFVGNVEARDILSGDYDVVVSDGFSGNIALKSAEGTANAVFSLLKQGIMKSTRAKIGALLLKPVFRQLKHTMDYNENGGAPFLGVKKPVVKAHGASKAKSICGAILQVRDMIKGNVVGVLGENIKQNDEQI